jgi:hypothetical protein
MTKDEGTTEKIPKPFRRNLCGITITYFMQHNITQHSDIQHNDTQHNNKKLQHSAK